jgi:hypothetical protein
MARPQGGGQGELLSGAQVEFLTPNWTHASSMEYLAPEG